MVDLREEFGTYLRELRKSKGLTVRKLEKESGVSQSYITNVENGKRGIPSPEILNKLSGPLGVSHAELMVKAGHVKYEDWFENRVPGDEYDKLFWHQVLGFTGREEFENFESEIKNGELTDFLKRKMVLYKGRLLSEQERQRISDMLAVLFSG